MVATGFIREEMNRDFNNKRLSFTYTTSDVGIQRRDILFSTGSKGKGFIRRGFMKKITFVFALERLGPVVMSGKGYGK